MCRWWFHWRLAEMLHNDDCGQYTWRSSRVRGRWLSTRFSKHVARDTQSRTFDKGLIKRCVSHMTSNSRTNKFLSYNLKCLILVQLIKSLNKLITQQIPRNSAVIRNQYWKRYDVIPLDSSCRAFRSNEQQITFENTYQLCSRQTRNRNSPQLANFHIYSSEDSNAKENNRPTYSRFQCSVVLTRVFKGWFASQVDLISLCKHRDKL